MEQVSSRELYGPYFMGLMRFIHFAAAYVFVGSLVVRTYWGFALHHVYSAFLVDAEEANGLMSSIFSGWKFIVPEPKEHEEKE